MATTFIGMQRKELEKVRAPANLPLWKNVLFSATGGVVGATCVYPLDIAKTQLQMDKAGKFKGLFNALNIIKAEGGMGALYRGLPANIIGIMPEKTIKLAGNDFFRGVFKVDDPKVCVCLVCVYVCVCVHMSTCRCVCVVMHTWSYVHSYTCVHACVCARILCNTCV
jgi:hypothetical protein